MGGKVWAGLGAFVAVCLVAASAQAASVAIVQGDWWTPDLQNVLVANGQTVTLIPNYTAASLAPFDAVIHYGNSYVDMAALETYVQGGGRLIETPWFWWNFAPTAPLQVITHGSAAQHAVPYPGVTVLDASDPLLDGVSFPAAGGGLSIGRTLNSAFVAGVTQVADWADGTAMIGYRSLGAGEVVGINMHVITSDTAYWTIHEPWATQLFLNAVQAGPVVPEPLTLLGLLLGAGGLVGYVRKRRAA